MKKAITLLIAMYLYLIIPMGSIYLESYVTEDSSDTNVGLHNAIFALCLVFLLIVGVFNIKSAIKLLRNGDYNKLRSEMKIAKLGSIPFFVAEFVLLLGMAVGFSFLALFFFWTIVGPIFFILLLTLAALILYAVMLISSAYGITFVILLRKQGLMNLGVMILCILAMLAPIADVIVTIVLLSKYEKRTENWPLAAAL